MKVLVTGATGFIGSHLVERLIKDGHQVWCVVRPTSDKDKVKRLQVFGAKILVGDLKKIKKINLPTKVDWVFHLAALVDTTDKFSYPTLYRENVKPSQDLAKFYLGKIKRFVFLSSMAAIGIHHQSQLVTEKTACQPTSNYGRSKLEAENCLLKLNQEKGLPVVILRASTVYGPGEHYNFLKLAQAIFKKRFWLIGLGRNLMSFCYVDNVINAVILAAKSKKGVGEVFLIDDGRPYSLKEVALEIAKAEGIKLSSFSIPLPLAYLAGIGFEFLAKILPIEPPLTRGRVATLTVNFAFNITKAKKILGYQPRISFSEAVMRTVSSFKKEGLLMK